MLALPSRGFAVSKTTHNVDLDALSDWIEASIIFDESQFSDISVIDLLCESQIYAKQDLASDRVAEAWRLLRRRETWLGAGCPFTVGDKTLTRKVEWQAAPAHSFCVLLACAMWYPKWAQSFGADYTVQGDLFERLISESLGEFLGGWNVLQTGWTRTRKPKLGALAKDIANRLGEAIGDPEKWASDHSHEAGLDLLCHKPFPDSRAGVPVFLMQCASGKNWRDKLHAPDMRTWSRIVQFAAEPKKAFATPFAILDDDFPRICNLVNGLLLDRYRILYPAKAKADWTSPHLRDDLVAWMRPRERKLPRLES